VSTLTQAEEGRYWPSVRAESAREDTGYSAAAAMEYLELIRTLEETL
jgi:hypothetical protein